jgi:putative ABC transport system permease protein
MHMTFLQFASNNVKRNARAYSGYLLSSSFAVMIFFVYAMFYFHPDIATTPMGQMTKVGMKAAEYMIFIVSFLFVLYSVSAFLKARQKEFGILSILGAADRQIHSLIFLENMIIGFAAILLGIVSGLMLSKLFLLLGAKVLEMKEMRFYLPWEAMLLTTASFLGLFLFISLFSVALVRKNKVLQLLQGTSKPKPEPKASVLLGVLSLACFTAATLLIRHGLSDVTMLIIVALGLVGTYFFFTQLSVLLIRLLKKNRLFFWRGTNLIWVSEMAYRIKDNARMFFLVTLVTTMSCSAVSLVLSLKQSNAERYLSTPYAVEFSPGSNRDAQPDLDQIESALRQAGVSFTQVKLRTFSPKFQEFQDYSPVVSRSQYNTYAQQMKYDRVEAVGPDEAVWIGNTKKIDGHPDLPTPSKLTMPDNTLSLAKVRVAPRKIEEYAPLVVVADSTFERMHAALGDKVVLMEHYYYFVPAWKNDRVPSNSDPEVLVAQKLTEWNEAQLDNDRSAGYLSARGSLYMELKQTTNVIIFIGAFIAAIFSISTASFLYFKLYTDLTQDQASYRALSKIGLSTRDMQKSSTIQIAALFFIPLVVASVQTLAALLALRPHLSGLTIIGPTLLAIGAFLALQLLYFVVVRARYLARLKQVMV